MDSHRSEHARGVAGLLLRHRVGGLLHVRRAVRQPGPPRGGRPHRHARPRLAPQDLGPAADDPHARRPAGLRLPLPPGRPAAAARRPRAQRHRPGGPGRRPAALPPRRRRPPDGTFVLPDEGCSRRTATGRLRSWDGSVRRGVRSVRGPAYTREGGHHPARPARRSRSAGDAPDARCASPRRPAPSAAGPAGGPVRSTDPRDEELRDPGPVLRGEPARGGLPGRRHARGHRPAPGRRRLDDRRAGLRDGRPDPAVRLRPGRPAAARADLRRHGAGGHHGRLPQRGRGHRRLPAGPGPGHPRLRRPRRRHPRRGAVLRRRAGRLPVRRGPGPARRHGRRTA